MTTIRKTTSEVGFAAQQLDLFREFLQTQNTNFSELVSALKAPSDSAHKILKLPAFNSNSTSADVVSWCHTVDLIMADKPLEGSALIIALSDSIDGEAAEWLSQVCYSGIKWADLKDLFIQRFKGTETPAATMIGVFNSRPKEGENISAYGNRLVTSLITKWKTMSTEEIAVSVVLAHSAVLESRLQRLIFTTHIKTRSELQQHLSAYSYGKRKDQTDHSHTGHEKRQKLTHSIKCHFCGKLGHKQAECRSRRDGFKMGSASKQIEIGSHQNKTKSSVVCFKCGKIGHISTACTQPSSTTPSNKKDEKRVNVCTMLKPQGMLMERGKCYQFYFDSGAECSLIKESIAAKFSGKRINNCVILRGIGNAIVYSTMQIITTVTINNFNIEILFHVVVDNNLVYNIILGCEILSQGFSATITNHGCTLSRLKGINILSKSSIDFDNINTDLEGEEKNRLVSILSEYSEWLITEIPNTRISTGELQIRLIDPNKTVQRRPYRLSPDEREIVREEIKKLIKANVIQPSNSPFASPIVLVKKKNGNNRLCVDYRELNSNTVSDKYPLPLIADQIARLKGAVYFCQLDMASGFHQVPIHSESVQFTAFITPDGHYEYLAMPFGLKNAPACFQRAIVAALGELAYSYVVVYMDDVMIVANSKEEAFQRLQIVLNVLTKAGFSLNLMKCAFLKTTVNYLGYIIKAGEVRPNPQKVMALSRLPPPKTVTQLRQFIGLASYFRQFIPKFSLIMKPLYHLVSSKVKTLSWNPNHEDIRRKIISVLSNEPVLVIFDPKHPIELHTDASTLGYGAILLHRIESKPHVIEYYSQTTSSPESRYTSYELETLAVVNSIKHFRHYLMGSKFIVFTDCNSLKASRTKLDLTPRVHRWWSYLQTFDFDIKYREGKRMAHVDFFSRNPVMFEKDTLEKVKEKHVNLAEISNDWLRAEQQRDQEISNIVAKLKNNELPDDLVKTYDLRQEILYRKVQRLGRTKCLPIVPRVMRWSVINNIHESIMHLGYEKTLDKVFQYYWFEGMSKYVKKFIDNCITCKVSKSHSGKIPVELHPIPKVDIPWHTIHMDITGKLSGKSDIKEYLVVTIDAFTKYVMLHHTHNINSDSCIKALKASIFLFGIPARIIADQGRSFASREYRDFCSSQNISLHLIATGASRANGQVERVMSTLKNMLTAVETSQRSWQDAVAEIQLALNSTTHRVTKYSPLELLIGKNVRPLGLLAADEIDKIDREEIREKAANNMYNSACYEKFRFDKNKAPVFKFKLGDFVLLKNEERHQTKLDPKFKGPFKISKVLGGDRYELRSLSNNRTYKYAHEYLRRLPDGEIPDDLEENKSVERDAKEKNKSVERDAKENNKSVERDAKEKNKSVERDAKEKNKSVERDAKEKNKSVERDARENEESIKENAVEYVKSTIENDKN